MISSPPAAALERIGFALAAVLLMLAVAPVLKRHTSAWTRTLLVVFALSGIWHTVIAVSSFVTLSASRIPGSSLHSLATSPAAGLWCWFTPSLVCFLATRRFLPGRAWRFAASLPAFLFLLVPNLAPLAVFVFLVTPLAFLELVLRYNFLGLVIRSQLVFTISLAAAFPVYLLLVRRIADALEPLFDGLAPPLEIGLIFAAGWIWIPLYRWLSRCLHRRPAQLDAFSKRVIEDTATMLDLPARLEFLAATIGATFQVRKVLIAAGEDLAVLGQFGSSIEPNLLPSVQEVGAVVRSNNVDMVTCDDPERPYLSALVSEMGFSYLSALRYQDRWMGLLFVDSAPRWNLDEDQPFLRSLSRQVALALAGSVAVEERIRQERELLEQKHPGSLGEVSAAIAQEIRNPLSSIRALAQRLREDAAVERQYGQDLSMLIREADRLNRGLEQLLQFARPRPPARETRDVTNLLEAELDLLARTHPQARLSRDIEAGLILPQSDAELFRQITLNLVIHALQAGGDRAPVAVLARRDGNHVVLQVTDEGPGIAKESQDRIFDPFYTTTLAGTGLAIVRENTRRLGGDVTVESPLRGAHGTRMTVSVPAAGAPR